jgi:hypothetical protein
MLGVVNSVVVLVVVDPGCRPPDVFAAVQPSRRAAVYRDRDEGRPRLTTDDVIHSRRFRHADVRFNRCWHRATFVAGVVTEQPSNLTWTYEPTNFIAPADSTFVVVQLPLSPVQVIWKLTPAIVARRTALEVAVNVNRSPCSRGSELLEFARSGFGAARRIRVVNVNGCYLHPSPTALKAPSGGAPRTSAGCSLRGRPSSSAGR